LQVQSSADPPANTCRPPASRGTFRRRSQPGNPKAFWMTRATTPAKRQRPPDGAWRASDRAAGHSDRPASGDKHGSDPCLASAADSRDRDPQGQGSRQEIAEAARPGQLGRVSVPGTVLIPASARASAFDFPPAGSRNSGLPPRPPATSAFSICAGELGQSNPTQIAEILLVPLQQRSHC
jgi:hypothetical protein